MDMDYGHINFMFPISTQVKILINIIITKQKVDALSNGELVWAL